MQFEFQIEDIERKIEELKKFAEEKEIDLSDEINKLKDQRDISLKMLYDDLTDYQRVSVSRHQARPYTLDYIKYITTDFVELHGDRLFRDDPAIVGGLCKIDGIKFMIIGHQKGRTVEEKVYRNFGMANPEGYRKALRLYEMAERFNIPILTFIDTPGAYPGLEAEKHGQGEAIARNLMEMSGIKTPIISVVIGEGGSGGALGLGVADKVFMLENSVYSVISPEGCAAILYKDPSKVEEAANNLKLSSHSLLKLGLIDGIIDESLGGAHRDPECTALNLKRVVLETLEELKSMSTEELLEKRYSKFRGMGVFYK
ncbi:acetyl-CoA carboxylase carboxyltransferase subunit alpha [Fusobacterium massiliense]|jgi:acetyl-coA carboxylase, carboxyl transferase, alpha subunit|uniref:acetyl-CoA carboxylase carboxyltransferase subunit alpha n=1 Tax=Fusobacterium massiliense TaxID=1852365 RepID=UPI00093DE7A4|nr:acetyl-CoA carboxylase carboxyltransferase subunit alpha [Fusobacterium massiliense]